MFRSPKLGLSFAPKTQPALSQPVANTVHDRTFTIPPTLAPLLLHLSVQVLSSSTFPDYVTLDDPLHLHFAQLTLILLPQLLFAFLKIVYISSNSALNNMS